MISQHIDDTGWFGSIWIVDTFPEGKNTVMFKIEVVRAIVLDLSPKSKGYNCAKTEEEPIVIMVDLLHSICFVIQGDSYDM